MPINKILITCYSNNEASKKVILKNGGILEKCVIDKQSDKMINRYFIKINDTIFPRGAWLTTNRDYNCVNSDCSTETYES